MAASVAVIVGVGPGLGWALAKRFSQEGLEVICAARSTERLHALASGISWGRWVSMFAM